MKSPTTLDKQALVLLMSINDIHLSIDEHQALAVYLSVEALDTLQAREPFITLYAKGEALAKKLLDKLTEDSSNDRQDSPKTKPEAASNEDAAKQSASTTPKTEAPTKPVEAPEPEVELKPAVIKSKYTHIQQVVLDYVKAHGRTRFATLIAGMSPQDALTVKELTLGADAPLLVYTSDNSVVLRSETANYYASQYSMCFEVPCAEETVLKAGQATLVPVVLSLEAMKLVDNPEWGIGLAPRSGMCKTEEQKALLLANSPARIESDYRGQVFAKILNTGSKDYVAKKGERLVHGEFVRIERPFELPVALAERGTGG